MAMARPSHSSVTGRRRKVDAFLEQVGYIDDFGETHAQPACVVPHFFQFAPRDHAFADNDLYGIVDPARQW